MYLISYILPLFAFDFTLWDEVVEFMIFFIVLGFLCIYHNNFSVNIILELLQYRFYECSLLNADNIEVEKVIISKDYKNASTAKSRLSLPEKPKYIMEFEIENNPKILGGTRVEPNFGELGGGREYFTNDLVKVKIINYQKMIGGN